MRRFPKAGRGREVPPDSRDPRDIVWSPPMIHATPATYCPPQPWCCCWSRPRWRPILGERRAMGATTAAPTVPGGGYPPTSATATAAGLRPPRRRRRSPPRARRPPGHGEGSGWPRSADARPTTATTTTTPASVEPRIAERLGGMFSPYDGSQFASLRESHIEHIVAISEAHDSGL